MAFKIGDEVLIDMQNYFYPDRKPRFYTGIIASPIVFPGGVAVSFPDGHSTILRANRCRLLSDLTELERMYYDVKKEKT